MRSPPYADVSFARALNGACGSERHVPRAGSYPAPLERYVPLVVTPQGEGIQDSTPIVERFEAAAPSLSPEDPVLSFLSALLEEYGDEWGNKWMYLPSVISNA